MSKNKAFYELMEEYFQWLGKLDDMFSDSKTPNFNLCIEDGYALMDYLDDCYAIVQIKAEAYITAGKYATLLHAIRECNSAIRRFIQAKDTAYISEVQAAIKYAGQSVGDIIHEMTDAKKTRCEQLTPKAYDVLVQLADSPTLMMQVDIIAAVESDKATVKGALEELEGRRFVEYPKGPRSGAGITEAGKKYLS